ncbi:hypothetical protein DL93DRAFT_2052034 [Clavulina sp. PMI_390]|nr:hypothetical protein DL93DRAFT_2052034 [Clavulina sp. PMI_390]
MATNTTAGPSQPHSIPNPKGTHYTQQLHAALLRGAWAESTPGSIPGTTAPTLSWSELLRKYRKHTGNDDFANLASSLQAVSLLLIGSSSTSPSSARKISLENLDYDLADRKTPLRLGSEGQLREERKDEVQEILKGLGSLGETSTINESVLLTKAHLAYALGNPSECLSILSSVSIDSPAPKTSSVPPSLSITERLRDAAPGNKHSPQELWAAVERIRGRCMSQESLNHVSDALKAYDAGAKLIETLGLIPSSHGSISTTAKSEKSDAASFRDQRELWRWVERLLRRRAIVASQRLPVEVALPYLKIYRDYAYRWPPTFRPIGAAAVFSLYLRGLCLAPPFPRPTSLSISNSTSLPSPTSGSVVAARRKTWYQDAHECAEQLQKTLEASTVFPRAGEVNWDVNDFVDLCMGIWERGGCDEQEAEWIIDVGFPC